MKMKNGCKHINLSSKVLIVAGLSIFIGLAGCQDEGTAEKAGKKINRAVEKAELQVDQTTEKAGEKIEAAKQSVTEKFDDSAKSAGKAEEYLSDSVITVKVKAIIMGDSILNASHIDVTTVNGVVTLTGTVDSEQSLGRAMELAGSQKNVKSVETRLVVVSPSLL